jgi:uracil-DNA glycosylase family 4
MAEITQAKKPKNPKLEELALLSEPLRSAGEERELCQQCALYKHCKHPFTLPYVPPGYTSKALLVFDTDAEHGDSSDALSALSLLLKKAGYQHRDYAIAYAVRCAPKDLAEHRVSMRHLRLCRAFLIAAIQRLSPEIIVAFGRTAYRALTNSAKDTNVTAARGKYFKIPYRNADGELTSRQGLVTYDPDAAKHGMPELERYILDDLRLAKQPMHPGPSLGQLTGRERALAIDTEFDPEGNPLTVALATDKTANVWDIGKPEYGWISDIRLRLSRAEYMIAHSSTADIDPLIRLGLAKQDWITGEKCLDSLILARMVDENKPAGSYGLEELTCALVKLRPWKGPTEAIGHDAREWPVDLRMARCGIDAWASALVARHCLDRLSKDPQQKKLIRFNTMISHALHRMRLAGAMVDMAAFDEIGSRLREEREETLQLLQILTARTGIQNFSPTNDNHIRAWLFDCLKLPKTRLTKTKKARVDSASLTLLSGEGKPYNAELGALIKFNKADKLVSVWYGNESTETVGIRGVLREIVSGDCAGNALLPVRINPLGAKTGRRSSNNPNMQNWPKSVRKIIRSRWKNGVIANFDYKSLEVCLLAYVIKEKKLYDYFMGAESGYIRIGKDMFGKEVKRGTKEYTLVKSTVLGTNYNMSHYKLAHQFWDVLNIKLADTWEEHVEKSREVQELYFRTFPGLKRYIRAQEQELLKHQAVRDMAGSVRHLPLPDGKNTKGFKHFLNQAINFPIQALAAKVTGSALLDCEKNLCKANGISVQDYHRILLDRATAVSAYVPPPFTVIFAEVHDALAFDIHPANKERDIEIITQSMIELKTLKELIPDFKCTLQVECTVGDVWTCD